MALPWHYHGKTGRFGLGFNTVYHVTDVPMFASGDHVVMFDPHATHLPDLDKVRREKKMKKEKKRHSSRVLCVLCAVLCVLCVLFAVANAHSTFFLSFLSFDKGPPGKKFKMTYRYVNSR